MFTDNLKNLESLTSSPKGQQNLGSKALKRWHRCHLRLTGAHLLPFVDVFAFFKVSYDETLNPKVYSFTLLTGPCLKIHLSKGHLDPNLIIEHLGMIIDMEGGGGAPIPYCEA